MNTISKVCLLGALTMMGGLASGTARAESTALIGGAGGYWYSRQCPPGEFITGLGGMVGSYVDAVVLQCASVAGGRWTGAEAVPKVGDFRRVPTVSPVSVRPGFCNNDRLINSITVEKNSTGAFVSSIQAGCGRIDGAPGRTAGPRLRGNGPRMWGGQLDCPAGQFARGISGKSGEFVDSIRLDCAPLTGPYAEDTVMEAGGAGGAPAESMCPDAQRMVGLISRVERGPFGIWINGLRPVCADMPTWDDQHLAVLFVSGAAPALSMGHGVGGSGGNSERLMCPAGQYVEAMESHYGQFVHSVRLRCRTMTYSAAAPTARSGRSEGRFELLQCPGDMVAAGIVVRAGSALDAVRLRCRRDSNPGFKLLAILGDSFSAGEGAPDVKVSGGPGPTDEPPRERTWRAGWADRACHRSNLASTTRAAREIVRRTNGDVVFRNFSCSGAISSNLAVEAQEETAENAAAIDPQLNTAMEWSRSRGAAIDTLLLGIGGNDAGFSARIADCAVTEMVEGLTLGIASGSCGREADYRENITSGLRMLQENFEALPRALQRANPRQVFLRTYPDPMRNRLGFCDQFTDLGPRPGGIVSGIPDRILYDAIGGFTGGTSELVYEQFIARLNEFLVNRASQRGWRVVNGWAEASRANGFCAADGERFFNIPSDTHRDQGNFYGVFHPNAAGYEAEVPLLVNALLPTLTAQIQIPGRTVQTPALRPSPARTTQIDRVQRQNPAPPPAPARLTTRQLQAAVDTYLAGLSKRNPRLPQRAHWDPRAKPSYTPVRPGTQVETDVMVGRSRVRMRFIVNTRGSVTNATRVEQPGITTKRR